jgi:hypothetical protein
MNYNNSPLGAWWVFGDMPLAYGEDDEDQDPFYKKKPKPEPTPPPDSRQ